MKKATLAILASLSVLGVMNASSSHAAEYVLVTDNANAAAGATHALTKVWDDGHFTYLAFAAKTPVPTIYRVTAGGDALVNARVSLPGGNAETIITIDLAKERLRLRDGEQEFEILPVEVR